MRKSSTVVSAQSVAQFYIDTLTEIYADTPHDDVSLMARSKRECLVEASQRFIQVLADVEEFLEANPDHRM